MWIYLRRIKIKEYKEREHFWNDKRISQLSFHNNLLLTVGIALIGYFWKELDSVYKNLFIGCNSSIDWKVILFLVGIGFLSISVFSGFLLSLSRLYDLRLTAHIVYTRRKSAEKDIKLNDQSLSEACLCTSMKSLWSVFWNYRQYEMGNGPILQEKFTQLRQKSKDLGRCTWALLNLQTLCMLISMFFLIIGTIGVRSP